MDTRTLAHIGGVALLSVAATAAALDWARQDNTPQALVRPSPRTAPDPLLAEQRRCQHKGEAAAADGACLRAWALTRERFLRPRTGVEPSPDEAR
ncbi:conjugal transfer protein TrbK [Mesorhizobium loti]|nr:putative entry exclusion protein TrbK-alt [Mesorhizobium loti]PLP60808.1 conjugal transfer protein TrbK [Mesorhizobium loti]